ncbi:hypothetical protein RHO14_02350 [Orbus wheelerorum]|uniref:hypothetical protein n=1 Tax=Orbus wheelerorum TaxID=3074111 RepID=UPI00370D66B8
MANISMTAIDVINYKLSQANVIITLLIGDCDSNTPINRELRSDTLGALSDLIAESKTLLK